MTVKTYSAIKGVELTHDQTPSGLRLVQKMQCSTCDETQDFSNAKGGTYPEEALFKFARQKGWHPDKRGKHVCPKCLKRDYMQPKEATEAPREMTPKDRRAIFREIDECYDDVNERYCDDFTDHKIAVKLGMPRKWVENIREESFGASGENIEMERVATLLGRVDAELKEAVNNCVDAAARAEKTDL